MIYNGIQLQGQGELTEAVQKKVWAIIKTRGQTVRLVLFYIIMQWCHLSKYFDYT